MTLLPPLHDELVRAARREQAARRPLRRRLARALPLLGALFALSATGVAATQVVKRLDVAAVREGARPPAPDRTLPRLDAPGSASLARYRGQVVVLSFFASWCPPCREQTPALARVHAALERDGEGTALLVSTVDRARDARAYLAQRGLRIPTLHDRDGTLMKAYGSRGIPAAYVIDADGRVVAMRLGEATAGELRRAIARARHTPSQGTRLR